ncbi:hypothetical protein NMY22_g12246 [Coprinellus aureogranulatus]|nr:hypothetical protein NMY22_g12246 [Coprinellus aureogranulatus]
MSSSSTVISKADIAPLVLESDLSNARNEDREGPISSTKIDQGKALHDVAPDAEIDDALVADAISLDSRFTRAQLAAMSEHKEEYMESTKKQKAHLTRSIADQFIEDILKTGAVLNGTQRKRLLQVYPFTCLCSSQLNTAQNVQYWFSQRCRVRGSDVPRFFHQYTARQVFYKENAKTVARTQAKLYAHATGRVVEASDSEDEPEDIDDVDGESATLLKAKSNGKPVKPFDFLQLAITEEYDRLSDEEKAKYDKMASEWKLLGPAEEVKRSRAEKDLGRYLYQFAEDLYRHMGAKLYFFVSFTDSKGQHVTLQKDFGKQLYGAKKDFREIAHPIINKSGVSGRWNEYTKDGPSQSESDKAKDGELLRLPLNDYLEPIIPHYDESYYPKDLPPFEYLQKVVRCVMSHCHALAMGNPIQDFTPTEENRFHWGSIGPKLFQYAKRECFPDSVDRVCDPSGMRKPNCLAIVKHWYERQQIGLIPLEFHSYYKKGTKKPVPRVPRVLHDATSEPLRHSQRHSKRTGEIEDDSIGSDSSEADEEEDRPLRKGKKRLDKNSKGKKRRSQTRPPPRLLVHWEED